MTIRLAVLALLAIAGAIVSLAGSSALAACARQLDSGWLAPASRIYVERARREALPALPAAWQELRSGRAGEVGYHLFGAGGAVPTGSETRT